ncbi:MAG TPA: type II secretion system F family protein, partial [Gemmataceae bacterium]|nr:type II secretion system F family protein [Gemmataceae bacterium]
MPQESMLPFMMVFTGIAVLVLLLWLVISAIVGRRREEFKRRMGKDDSDASLTLIELPPTTLSGRMDRGFARMVERTGLDMDTTLALGIILLFGVVCGAAAFVWRFEEEPWVAIPAFFLGCLIPLVFFGWRQRVWRRQMQAQLPDALYLLARSVRAGRSIDQGIQLVGDAGVQPLAREFSRMHRQLELGLSLSQTLQIAANRIGLIDFNVFASVLSLHRGTGGNLPTILDRLASATRDRNQFEGQYRAATVLGRYSAIFIVSLACFIMFYLFFFQREWAMKFFDTRYSFTGIYLFVTAIALEIIGG